MSIESVGISLATLQQGSDPKPYVPTQQTPAGKNSNGATLVSLQQDAAFSSAFDSKEATSATVRMIASNIRMADNTMVNINDLISKMKSELGQIVKQFPPYPPGSGERIKFLKNYSGLRRLIEQLTIPPDYQFAQKILSAPTQGQGAGDQTITIGQGGPSVTIKNQSVDPGQSGLNIPDLPDDATDDQVKSALAGLESAQTTVNQKRTGLASDAYNVARTVEFAVKNTNIGFTFSGQSATINVSEVSIGIKSTEVRQTISAYSAASLTGNNNASLRTFL